MKNHECLITQTPGCQRCRNEELTDLRSQLAEAKEEWRIDRGALQRALIESEALQAKLDYAMAALRDFPCYKTTKAQADYIDAAFLKLNSPASELPDTTLVGHPLQYTKRLDGKADPCTAPASTVPDTSALKVNRVGNIDDAKVAAAEAMKDLAFLAEFLMRLDPPTDAKDDKV